MAIRKVQEVPRALPHARLFLDDLETVTNILVEAHARAKRQQNAQVTVSYRIRDAIYDSIADLEQLGGSTNEIEIILNLGGREVDALALYGRFTAPVISLYELSAEERWAVHAKLHDVFLHRGMYLKNLVLSAPKWLKIAFFTGGNIVLWSVTLFNIPGLHAWLIDAPVILSFLVAATVGYRSSRVNFVRSYERRKLLSTTTKSWALNGLFFVLGLVVKEVVQRLVPRFFK